jgi:hypothetical protein
MKWRSIGLKGVWLAPVLAGGGMNEEALALVGKTLRGSAGFNGDEPTRNDFYSNESQYPEESVLEQVAMQALKYGLMDLDPDKVIIVAGGESVEMIASKKYRAARTTIELEHCARVITDFGIVLDFPRLKTTAAIAWPLDRQNLATINVTHSVMEPHGVNDAPYEWYQAGELTEGQEGYGLFPQSTP